MNASRPPRPAPRSQEAPEVVNAALARSDVQALQSLSAAPDKQISKAAKRALHKLRARGVLIPDRESERKPSPESTLAAPFAEVREPVWVTTIDGGGNRAIFLPLKAPRGFVLHLIVSSDERGILSLTSRELSRRQLRTFKAELTPETLELLREIPLAAATALLTAALEMSPLSGDAVGIREILRSLPRPRQESDGQWSDAPRPVSEPADTSAALRDSMALFETPALRSYIPPEGVVLAVGQKLEEVLLSPLLIDDAQRLAQLRHALERATADYFTAARRKLYAARLLDTVELFSKRGNTVSSAQARAVGDAFLSDLPIHEIPFARGLFERIFDLEAAAKAKRPTTEEVKPESGGLILPGR